jgi:hypothetical protein
VCFTARDPPELGSTRADADRQRIIQRGGCRGTSPMWWAGTSAPRAGSSSPERRHRGRRPPLPHSWFRRGRSASSSPTCREPDRAPRRTASPDEVLSYPQITEHRDRLTPSSDGKQDLSRNCRRAANFALRECAVARIGDATAAERPGAALPGYGRRRLARHSVTSRPFPPGAGASSLAGRSGRCSRWGSAPGSPGVPAPPPRTGLLP